MPEITFPNTDALPEDLRQYAKAVEGSTTGAVVVNLVANDKLREFRDKNTDLLKDIDALKPVAEIVKKVFGEDANEEKVTREVTNLRDTAKRVQDGTLKESKEIESAVNTRTAEMRATFEEQIRTSAQKLQEQTDARLAAENRVKRQTLRQEITAVAMDEKSGVQSSAIEDIITRASKVFHVGDDGALTPKKGGEVLYGSDGSPMSPSEWLSGLKPKNPHLFKGSQGGGSSQNGDRKFGGFTQEAFNKLSPEKKLEIANANAPTGRRGRA